MGVCLFLKNKKNKKVLIQVQEKISSHPKSKFRTLATGKKHEKWSLWVNSILTLTKKPWKSSI